MAIINLKDVTVTRLNGKGHGLKVTEQSESKGKTFKTTYTVWFNEPSNLSVGDVVSLSGFLGAKVGDPWKGDDGQERRSVELSVNQPRINGDNPPAAPATDEPWAATAGGYSDPTPF